MTAVLCHLLTIIILKIYALKLSKPDTFMSGLGYQNRCLLIKSILKKQENSQLVVIKLIDCRQSVFLCQFKCMLNFTPALPMMIR